MTSRLPSPARPALRPRRSLVVGFLLLAAAAALELGCGAALPSMPVVEVMPATVSLQAGGGQQQFTATVANAVNKAVVWKVNGQMGGNSTDGSISQGGLYQAPASIPTGAIEVEAYSVSNANAVGKAVVNLSAGVTVTIDPAKASVSAGASQQFSATVSNAQDTSVTWSVNGTVGGSPSLGTITATGLYTAPTSFPGLNGVSVTATSNADKDISATAAVSLVQPVGVTITPATAIVNVGQSTVFSATVSGSSNETVNWSVDGVAGGNATLGTIDAQGVFTAPASVPSPATETVSATSAADPTKSATAKLTIAAPLAIAISPQTATAKANQTVQFTSTVANAQNTAVTWAVNGATGGSATVGTISSSGLYTAPATFPGLDQVNVTVTSVEEPTLSASATVTLVQPVTVSVAPATATVNLGSAQSFAATVTGSTNQAVSWSVNGIAGGNATLGTIDQQGVFTAPTTLPATAQETITATSQADTSQSGTAQITLQKPPQQFTLSPASSSLSLDKAASGTVSLQLGVSDGFSHPIQFAASGLPPNVTAAFNPTSATASGTVTLTLTTASISLATSALPVSVTATSSDDSGHPIVQTATVLLTINGWAGQVRTLAGGPGGVGFEDGTGTADELNPTAVVSDGSNTVYFADKRGNALRSYGLVNQTVTTLLGGPYTYSIGEGDGLAYDAATQTVYVADALRNRVLAYTAGQSGYRVLAGSDTSGHADGVGAAASFSYPHGLALSPDGSTLYVADTDNQLIRAINTASGAVTTIAGQYGVYSSDDATGTAATFCQPTGLAIDAAGANLYVSDACNNLANLRQIALPSLAVTSVAGSKSTLGQSDGAALTAATFLDPVALAVDPHSGANLIYIADADKIRALRLNADASKDTVFTLAGAGGPGQSDGTGASASFYNPGGLATLAIGSSTTAIFVADADNGLLRRIDLTNPLTADGSTASLTVSTLAGQPSHRGSSDGVGTGSDYSGTSTASFSQPEGIVTDDQTAYVADSTNAAIRKIDLASTQVTTVAGGHQGFNADSVAAGSAAFYQPAGIAWVPSQKLIYIADTGNGAIRKLDLSSNMVSTLAGTNQSGYNPPDQTVSFADARFNHPYGILASSDGTKLYVADTGNNAIREIDLSTGQVSTIAGNGGLGNNDGIGTAARFAEPNGLAFDASGQNLFISDFENQAIRELNLSTGQVTTIVGLAHRCGHDDGPAASASLCDPAFLSTDGRSLFWGDSNTGLLRVLNLKTMMVSTLAGAPGLLHMADGDFTEAPGELTGPVRYNGVFGLAVSPDDTFILFTDKTANVVRIIK